MKKDFEKAEIKKQTIALPIEWIKGLKKYTDEVKKTIAKRASGENSENSENFEIISLLGYLESLDIFVLEK